MMFRVLLRLKKGEQIKYIAHLDLMRAFEHALRRARIPVLYSSGFNPRPKMHFGGAIGVGVTSDDERIVLDLECDGSTSLSANGVEPPETKAMSSHRTPKEIMARLNRVMPVGMEILEAADVPEGTKPLGALNAAEYRIGLRCPADPQTVRSAVDELMAADEIKVVRKRDESKEIDIRRHILGIEVDECAMGKLVLTARLMAGSSGGARPQDLVQALADRLPGLEVDTVHKVRQYAV